MCKVILLCLSVTTWRIKTSLLNLLVKKCLVQLDLSYWILLQWMLNGKDSRVIL